MAVTERSKVFLVKSPRTSVPKAMAPEFFHLNTHTLSFFLRALKNGFSPKRANGAGLFWTAGQMACQIWGGEFSQSLEHWLG